MLTRSTPRKRKKIKRTAKIAFPAAAAALPAETKCLLDAPTHTRTRKREQNILRARTAALKTRHRTRERERERESFTGALEAPKTN